MNTTMNTMTNRLITLSARPDQNQGSHSQLSADSFKIFERAVPELGPGEVLLANMYLSLDPYMAAYSFSVQTLDEAVEARVVSRVVASNNKDLSVGDVLWGFFGWELYTVLPPTLQDRKGYDVRPNRIDPANWPDGAPLSYAISLLGMPGLTAHVGIVDIGKAQAGETVYISSAAGPLGQVAGQIAKQRGCYVVGSAGSDAKVEFVLGLGYDAAFNYKTTPNGIQAALETHCPNGIDVYFDNVGGETLDAVFMVMNKGARLALCGMISTYQSDDPYRLGNMFMAVRRAASMTGFVIYDHFPHKMPAYISQMGQMLAEGKIRYQDAVIEGLDNLPDAFIAMLSGQHGMGKCVIALPEAAKS